jgi:hypothetical protein
LVTNGFNKSFSLLVQVQSLYAALTRAVQNSVKPKAPFDAAKIESAPIAQLDKPTGF